MKAIYLLSLTLLMQLVQIFSALFNIKFAFSTLSQDNMSVWIIYLSIVPFLVLFDGNLSVTLTREVAFSKKLNNNLVRLSNLINSSDFIVNRAFYILTGITLSFFFLYNIFAQLNNSNIFNATLVFFISLIVKLKSNYSLAKVFAFGMIIEDRLIKIVSTLLNLLFLYLLLKHNYSLYSLGIAYLLQSLIVIIVADKIVSKKITFQKTQRRFRQVTRRLLHPTKEYLLVAIPGIFVLNSGIFFLKHFHVDSAIIISYGLSSQILAAIMGIGIMIPSTFQPIISHAYSKKEDFKIKTLVLLKIYYLIIFTIMCNFFIYKEEFFELWLGKDTVNDVVFNSLFVVYLFEMIQVPLTIYSVAIGYLKFAKITALSSFLILTMTYPLLVWFGYYSVAILILIVQIMTCHQFNIRKFIYLFNINFNDFKSFLQKTLLSTITITALILVVNSLELNPILKIFISAIMSILILFLFLLNDLKRISKWI